MAIDLSQLKSKGFMPQKQPGLASTRLKFVGGAATVEQLETIVEVARKYGRGVVHLTSRQGMEIPYVKAEDAEEVERELEKGGVALGAAGARVRSITACQGGCCCPSGIFDAQALAKDLDERFGGRALPHKFKIGATACPNNCLKAEENDVGIKGAAVLTWKSDACVGCGLCAKACVRRRAATVENRVLTIDEKLCVHCGKCAKACRKGALLAKEGWALSFGGTFGNNVIKGRQILPILTDRDSVFRAIEATLDFFATYARPKERLVATIRRRGWKDFQKRIEAAVFSKEQDANRKD